MTTQVEPARRKTITIVGAGLGGALFACLMGRAGHEVTICERRPDPRRGAAGRGRSINLAISVRGLHALARAGLEKKVLEMAVPMRGRMIHPVEGPLVFQPYGTEAHHVIHSVSRADLNRMLVEEAERLPGVRVLFDKRCVAMDLDAGRVTLQDGASGAIEEVDADVVVGADGAYSEVRAAMQRTDRFEYSQSYLAHGYKELTIPPGPSGRHLMDANALHIWPRGGFMTIALPNADGSFTCTCFWPFEGDDGLLAERTREGVLDYFRRVFPDMPLLIPDLAEDFLLNPVGSLVTVRCAPWHWKGRVVLLGDAAHAIVPFYGQGANASFEDCVLLDEAMRSRPDDLEAAFADYFRRRKEHADALADLAIGNFYEMRDKTASRAFRLGKAIERGLHRIVPGRFVPLYYLVTFSRTPYADAMRRAARQWRVVRWTAAIVALALAAAAVLAGGALR